MSVTVAITVTIPNATAASIVAAGSDFTNTIGNEVIRLVERQIVDKVSPSGVAGLGAVTAATVVT